MASTRSLYFVSFELVTSDATSVPPQWVREPTEVFGVQPHHASLQPTYASMTREVSLTRDVGWDEAKLQRILRKSGIFSEFPHPDTALVRAEFKPGTIDQRIDLLLLASSGELVPCELKIRGDYPDSHGQLLRYVADLHFDIWTMERVRDAHAKYRERIDNEVMTHLVQDDFERFVELHRLPTSGSLPVRKGGVIIDVEFEERTRAAVRYLNQHGFRIELLQVRARVPDDWDSASVDRLMRLDFEPVDP